MSQIITFFASLFGDLIESIIKRDAEMKVSHLTQVPVEPRMLILLLILFP